MLKRAITSFFLIGFVVAMLYFGVAVNYIFFDALILVFATIGMYEIHKSLKLGGHPAITAPLVITVIGVYPAWHFMGLEGMLAVFLVSMAVGMTIFTFDQNKNIDNIFSTIFALIYPYFFLSFAFLLTKEHCALFAFAFAIFIPVATDTFAYLVGSQLGKHKLCPTISPKKTVEGAIGGLAGAVVMSVVFFLLFEYYALFDGVGYVKFTSSAVWSAVIYIALGIAGGCISQVGDLFASRIKRQLGVKDYGNIFPGHGGALDRVDSIMFMLVLIFVAFQIIY